ncbi:hypothetical protein BDQ17DRAFT_1390705 [Cyathus striatus]|nr:hypothetical protein BDQ17DRAFT_1390705 [Cyathus striatus]
MFIGIIEVKLLLRRFSFAVSNTCSSVVPCILQFPECDSAHGYLNYLNLEGSTKIEDMGNISDNCKVTSVIVQFTSLLPPLLIYKCTSGASNTITLRPTFLPSRSIKGVEAVAFFETVVKLFQTLPTPTRPPNVGITPSPSKTFTLSQPTSELKSASGVTPALDCTSSELNQISWYFNLKGSIIDGTFVAIGTLYPPKSGSGSSSSTSTPTSTPSGTPGSLPSKATIHAIQSGSTVGGLLSTGTWSTQTLTTFTIGCTSSSFTMTSSKGSCGVSSGTFSCGSEVTLTTFSAVTSGSSLPLASGGSMSFTSDSTPSGSTVFSIFTGMSHSEGYTLSIVST